MKIIAFVVFLTFSISQAENKAKIRPNSMLRVLAGIQNFKNTLSIQSSNSFIVGTQIGSNFNKRMPLVFGVECFLPPYEQVIVYKNSNTEYTLYRGLRYLYGVWVEYEFPVYRNIKLFPGYRFSILSHSLNGTSKNINSILLHSISLSLEFKKVHLHTRISQRTLHFALGYNFMLKL